MNLSGCQVLLIAPRFFGYEDKIVEKIKKRGANVIFIQENIDSNNFGQRVINKMSISVQQAIRSKQFMSELAKIDLEKVDYVIGIRLDLIPEEVLDYIRKKCNQARFILYFWDSVKNMRNAVCVSKYFDRVLTFDLEDYRLYKDLGWKFRPLFYTDDYCNIRNLANRDIDLLYISSLSPKRAEWQIKLEEICNQQGLKLFSYFYIKPYVFWVNSMTCKQYRDIDKNLLHGEGLDSKEVCELFEKSKNIFDCSSPSQTGLTMRTIECLGAKKKLLTTNESISKYVFYDENNIRIVKETITEEDISFINDDGYSPLPDDLYNLLSIDGWIDDLFAEQYDSKTFLN